MISLFAKTVLNEPIVSGAPDRAVTVSVVSHGHSGHVRRLALQLCEEGAGHIDHLVLTHNVPEAPLASPPGGWPFRVTELFNERPRGFGANHNQAFVHCGTRYFCVLNPDVTVRGQGLWDALLAQASQPGVGLAYPVLLNPDGSRQDSERAAVTPLSLLRRHLFGRAESRIDWASAAFWVVPAPVYRALAGFDERYFMYCEDIDFCLRLRLAGWSLARAEEIGRAHV